MDETTYQCFRNGDQTRNVQLILAQIQHFQRPIPLQHLRDVSDPCLTKHIKIIIPILVPQKRTLKSFPLKSKVLSAPTLGSASNARTLSSNAALGPESCACGCTCRLWCCVCSKCDIEADALCVTGTTGCRVVIPPWDDDVMIGISCPVAERGFRFRLKPFLDCAEDDGTLKDDDDVAVTGRPRRARGT